MKKRILLTAFLSLAAFMFGYAQRTITGIVNDQTGQPMVGASVVVKGTSKGVVTDLDGKYSLEVPANATTLVYSFTGSQTQEIALGSSNVVDIQLKELQLQEVVVTAIGIQREKKSLGYSATDLKSADIMQRSESDPIRTLAGKVAGVNIVEIGRAHV